MKYDKYNKYDKYVKYNKEVKPMERPKNFAPKSVEGDYKVIIRDNAIHIMPVVLGIVDTANSRTYRCHPDDKFDAGWVLNDYFEKKDKIGIGDRVTVTNHGECYPCARKWIIMFANIQRKLGNADLADSILLDWDGSLDTDGNYYRVVDSYVYLEERVFLIREEKGFNKFYIVGEKGLKKVD